jgi:hypothetical protein
MRIPWFLPQCGYPGCQFKVWKRHEVHCRKHYEQVLAKIGRINGAKIVKR